MNDAPYLPLFEAMDGLAPSLGEEVVMQVGPSGFEGKNSRCFRYLPEDEMQAVFDRAGLIVCHAGIGTILNGMDRNIPLVLVPRCVVRPGTETDQQMTVARKVEALGRGVVVETLDGLGAGIARGRALEFGPYKRDTSLCDFLSDLLRERAGLV